MIKFCRVCHQVAYRIQEEGETVKVVQGDSTPFIFNKKSSVNIEMSCPNGHPVRLEIKPEEDKGGRGKHSATARE